MTITRRALLGSILAAGVAPAYVRTPMRLLVPKPQPIITPSAGGFLVPAGFPLVLAAGDTLRLVHSGGVVTFVEIDRTGLARGVKLTRTGLELDMA